MKLSHSFLATILAAVAVSAQPLDVDARTAAISPRLAEPVAVEVAADALAMRDVARATIPEIEESSASGKEMTLPMRKGRRDLQVRDVQTRDLQVLDKRTFNVDLRSDSSTEYKVYWNGVLIICNIFFDLAAGTAVFKWFPDSSNPAPAAINIGFKILNSGIIVKAASLIPHDQKIPIPRIRPGQALNIFKG